MVDKSIGDKLFKIGVKVTVGQCDVGYLLIMNFVIWYWVGQCHNFGYDMSNAHHDGLHSCLHEIHSFLEQFLQNVESGFKYSIGSIAKFF